MYERKTQGQPILLPIIQIRQFQKVIKVSEKRQSLEDIQPFKSIDRCKLP